MAMRNVAAWALGFVVLTTGAWGSDDPPLVIASRTVDTTWPSPDSIKPVPLMPVPDDPPPHEGALFDLPTIIEPPDLIVVDVLEPMLGRPIQGERLVRPDGTIGLGFYGNVHVRGLTIKQAKEKIVLYLRAFLTDEALGLVEIKNEGLEDPTDDAKIEGKAAAQPKVEDEPANDAQIEDDRHEDLIIIPPADTARVYVDITRYDSMNYFVLGNVAKPGRLPFTGHETVLDVLIYAGGFVANTDLEEIRLYRPARGGKPAKVYTIDYEAILRNEIEKNYQIFPGDRLVVGKLHSKN